MANNFITIDASNMESIDYAAYLAGYFSAMGTATQGATTYYDSTYFAPFGYYDAGQVGVRYADSVNSAQVLIEGEHMQYDGIVGQHGSYSGSMDAITFGHYNESTTYAQINNVARSTLIGVDKELVVSGLDISAAVGAGTGADNFYYQIMLALRNGNSETIAEGNTLTNGELAIQMLYDAFAARGQHFIGSAGDDIYTGTKFKDKIDGGEGFDTLDGGKGKDVFIFELGDSANTIEGADMILGFMHGKDRIDLRGIDANINKDGDQAFKFIGNGDFTGKAGQLHFERSNGDTHISMDIDGDKIADMVITLDGKIKLTADDFFL